MNLRDIFESLPRPEANGGFSVERTTQRYRVGRSFEDQPALLIASPSNAQPIKLASIEYSPATLREVGHSNEATRLETLAVLKCNTTDPDLVDYFFRVVSSILIGDDRSATEDGFEAALDAIVNLFRALQQPAQMTVQGLWGELALIYWSTNITAALTSWRSNARALHDFSAGNLRLEVKGAATGRREHIFKLEQLESVLEGQTVVVSLLLGQPGEGVSVFELAEFIKERITGFEPARRLDAGIVQCLGKDWREAGTARYDLELARKNVRFYLASQIPSVPQPIPPEVKDVSFTVDLSTTKPLDLAKARTFGRFYADILPPE